MAKRVNFTGPQLCDKAIEYQVELIRFLESKKIAPGYVEAVAAAVDTIRYASFVAGSWQQKPIQDGVKFYPVDTL